MEMQFKIDDSDLTAALFLDLAQRVWPGIYDPELSQQALGRTCNITAWEGELLVGCVRILSDGYFFGTIPEILVDPAYQGKGIGRRLMEMAWESSPTSLFLGAQPGNEEFFEKMGYERSMAAYVKKKPRPQGSARWWSRPTEQRKDKGGIQMPSAAFSDLDLIFLRCSQEINT
jgi:GNAT superfamily N-acetyltransferase